MAGFRASLAESVAHLMIIRNARVLTFDSANRVLDSGTVEILPDGSIGATHWKLWPVVGVRLAVPAFLTKLRSDLSVLDW